MLPKIAETSVLIIFLAACQTKKQTSSRLPQGDVPTETLQAKIPSEREVAEVFDALEEQNDHEDNEVATLMNARLEQRPDEIASLAGTHSIQDASMWLAQLARLHAPIIYMHNGEGNNAYAEPYLLSDIRDYLAKVGLKYVDPKTKRSTVCIEPGKIKPDYSNLYDFECAGIKFKAKNQDARLELFIPPNGYDEITRGGNGKCYVTSKFVDPLRSADANIRTPATHLSGYAEITYMFWYPYNGNPVPSNPVSRYIFHKLKAGHHEGDWEHMTVRVKFDPTAFDPNKFADDAIKIVAVHYAAHASEESQWYTEPASPPSNLEKNDGYKVLDGRLVGLVATQTHATYNRLHEALRFNNGVATATHNQKLLGKFHILPSDKTAKGIKTDCRDVIVMLPTAESDWVGPYAWLNYPGRWGADPGGQASDNGPGNLPSKEWFFFESGL